MRKLSATLLLAFLTFGMPRAAQAQVTVAPFLTSNPQFLDGSGSPLASGCVFTYAAGTTTPLVTYSDPLGSTPNSNPVILNSGGFPQAGGIWLTSAAYKFVVKSNGGTNCSTGSTITTTDGITWATAAQTFAGIVSTGDVTLQQGTSATNGANHSSNSLKVQGTFWNGSASATDQWSLQDVLGTGANPTATLTWTHSGSTGATTLAFPGTLSITSNGPGGIGSSPSGGGINLQKTSSPSAIFMERLIDSFGNTNAQLIGLNIEQELNPSTTPMSLNNFGQVTEVFIPSSNTTVFSGQQQSVYGSISHFGSGNSSSAMYGGAFEAFNDGPSTVNLLAGVNGTANNGGVTAGVPRQTPTNNGNATNLRAFDGIVNNSSTGTVTNAAAFFAEAATNSGGGTLTNGYGLFVADQTAATNNFAIKTGAGKVSFGDTVTVGSWNSIRVVDGTKFTTINAAENDCSTANCIVIIPSTFACGSGQSLGTKDNITVWDLRQCSSPQATAGHLFYSVKDTNNGAVRDKMMVVDTFTPANDMSASSSSASFYTHAFAEGNLATFATLEAINGSITVDTGATNSPVATAGIEGEALVSGTVANTITDLRGGTFNVSDVGAGTVTNATAVQAQAATATSTGTITNAVGLIAENQTVGTSLNLGIWNKGQTELDKVVGIGQPPTPGTALFIQPIATLTTATQAGIQVVPQTSSAATGAGIGIRARADTAAAAFAQALNQGVRVDTPTVGAGSSIGEWNGVDIEAAPTAGTKCSIKMAGSTSGTTCINTSAVAGGTAAPIISTSFTTTAAATDNVTVTGMTSTGHCALEPTNSGAAGGIASVFVSAKAANQITVTHTATSGWTFDVMCSPI